MGGCNCGKKKTINNLQQPHYINMAVEVWNKVSNLSFEEITEELWFELYQVYNMIYPNSKGQPEKNELLKVIQTSASYKNKR